VDVRLVQRTGTLILWPQRRAVGLGSSLGEDPSTDCPTLLVWWTGYVHHHKKIRITIMAWHHEIKLVWCMQNTKSSKLTIVLLVFVLATFCWTKSLLCNVAAFTGLLLYPESTLQLCSSRRFCEVFKKVHFGYLSAV